MPGENPDSPARKKGDVCLRGQKITKEHIIGHKNHIIGVQTDSAKETIIVTLSGLGL